MPAIKLKKTNARLAKAPQEIGLLLPQTEDVLGGWIELGTDIYLNDYANCNQ